MFVGSRIDISCKHTAVAAIQFLVNDDVPSASEKHFIVRNDDVVIVDLR